MSLLTFCQGRRAGRVGDGGHRVSGWLVAVEVGSWFSHRRGQSAGAGGASLCAWAMRRGAWPATGAYFTRTTLRTGSTSYWKQVVCEYPRNASSTQHCTTTDYYSSHGNGRGGCAFAVRCALGVTLSPGKLTAALSTRPMARITSPSSARLALEASSASIWVCTHSVTVATWALTNSSVASCSDRITLPLMSRYLT